MPKRSIAYLTTEEAADLFELTPSNLVGFEYRLRHVHALVPRSQKPMARALNYVWPEDIILKAVALRERHIRAGKRMSAVRAIEEIAGKGPHIVRDEQHWKSLHRWECNGRIGEPPKRTHSVSRRLVLEVFPNEEPQVQRA